MTHHPRMTATQQNYPGSNDRPVAAKTIIKAFGHTEATWLNYAPLLEKFMAVAGFTKLQ